MQNNLGMLLLIVFGGTGLISIFVIVGALLPVPVEKTRLVLDASLGRSLLLGAVNFIFVALVDILVGWLGSVVGKVPGGILLVLVGVITLGFVLLAIIGLSAMSRLIGERIGQAQSLLATHVRGGILLFLAGLTPFLGWFIFTPLLVWTGLGAAIQAIFRNSRKTA